MKFGAQSSMILALVLCAGLAQGSSLQSRDSHPIASVIELIQGLIEKVENEGKTEAISWTEFDHWSANSVRTLQREIEKEKAEIDALTSKIEAKTKEEAELTEEISQLEHEIGSLDAADASAQTNRDNGANLYTATKADYEATIEAIGEALTALSGAQDSTTALAQQKVQKVMGLVSAMKPGRYDVLASFLESGKSAAPAPAPLLASGDMDSHTQTYKFKSGNVIELLKQLKATFEAELLEAEKAETNSLNSFALTKQARDTAKAAAEQSKSEKEGILSDVQGELAAAQGSLTDVQNDLQADSATLQSTQTNWDTKKSEWAERSDIRKREIAAMHAAIDILSKVGGVSTEAPSNPVPPPSPVEAEQSSTVEGAAPEFIQVPDPKMKAVNLLRSKAHTLHSKSLERLAQQIAAHSAGPFDDVIGMVQKMIFRLMAEQKDEDDHKNWCDLELSKTNASKVNKEETIAELTAKINDANANVVALTADISAADSMISQIESFIAEATEIRQVGKEENAQALRDAKDAQKAIGNAIAVIEAFYKETGLVPKESYELLQKAPVELPENPATWDSAYTGVSDPKEQPQGIISVLEGVLASFAQMESDTNVQEMNDQKAYDEQIQQASIEKARRTQETGMKNDEKKRLVDKIATLQRSKKTASGELESVEQYLRDLQPACVEGDSTYEERKSARSQEIVALQEAQSILQNYGKASAAPASAPAAFLQPVQRHA